MATAALVWQPIGKWTNGKVLIGAQEHCLHRYYISLIAIVLINLKSWFVNYALPKGTLQQNEGTINFNYRL